MIHKLDNTSIICLVIISLIVPSILAYEKRLLPKNKQPPVQYYIQLFVVTFVLIVFAISTCNERSKIENNIIIGSPEF